MSFHARSWANVSREGQSVKVGDRREGHTGRGGRGEGRGRRAQGPGEGRGGQQGEWGVGVGEGELSAGGGQALPRAGALESEVGLRNQEKDVRKDRGDGGLAFPEGTMAILPLKAALQGERKGLPEEGGGGARKGGRVPDAGPRQ